VGNPQCVPQEEKIFRENIPGEKGDPFPQRPFWEKILIPLNWGIHTWAAGGVFFIGGDIGGAPFSPEKALSKGEYLFWGIWWGV